LYSETPDGKGKYTCTVKLPDGTEITECGKSRKIARQCACKNANK
jgi:hypothetical protein